MNVGIQACPLDALPLPQESERLVAWEMATVLHQQHRPVAQRRRRRQAVEVGEAAAHDAEHRRVARENNDILSFSHSSKMPGVFEKGKKEWQSEIPKRTDENPYPQHEKWPWRLASFYLLMV